MKSPVIDKRNLDDLLKQLRERIPFYTPEWRAEDGDAGTAVLKIFAHMHMGILQRLNQATDKHFIAFLNMLGIKLIPARQAEVPITFHLSAGATEPVLIPAGTPIGAPDGDSQIHFETRNHLLAVPAKVTDLYAVDPHKDSINHAPSEWITGEDSTRGTFELFRGMDLQEHFIYIGDLVYFDVSSEVAIEVEMNGNSVFEGNKGLLLGHIHWQYWADTEEWADLESQFAEVLVLKKKDDHKFGELKVHGVKGRWIRGSIPSSALNDFANAKVQLIKVRMNAGITLPDFVFANDIPLDPLRPGGMYPFGKTPRLYDAFYMSSRQLFTKKGSIANIKFNLQHECPDDFPQAAMTAELSWEYWNGNGWVRIDGIEQHLHHTQPVHLEFRIPEDLAETSVSGQKGYWIRARLINGGYGSQQWDQAASVLVSKYCLPVITQMELTYQYEPEAEVDLKMIAQNNLEYRNLAEQLQLHHSVALFGSLSDLHRTLYIGFDQPLAGGPVSMYFSLQEQDYEEDLRPYLSWEYYQLQGGIGGWTKLDIRDETRYLTQSGCLVFSSHSDFAATEMFGKTAFWIRAVNTDDRFDSIAPAPKLRGVYLNTTVALQSETVTDEILRPVQGTHSTGFTLSKLPVFDESIFVNELNTLSESERQELKSGANEIQEEQDESGNTTAFWVRWRPVDQLMNSGPAGRHYEIDRTTGTVQFGDGQYGAILPSGIDHVKASYRSGGGAKGNVAADTVTLLRTSIAFVDRVTNPEPATGGFDTELSEQAIVRGPYSIKHRNRAVTVKDYEQLTLEAAQGIVHIKCLPNINDAGKHQSGWVTILIVPQSGEAQPTPSAELRRKVEAYLRERASNLLSFPRHIKVIGPAYAKVSVRADIIASSFESIPVVEEEAARRVKAYLHPLTGGMEGGGWEFGTIPCLTDFYRILESIPQADHVERLMMIIHSPEDGREIEVWPDRENDLNLPPHILVYSGEHQHTVKVSTERVP